MPRTATVDPPVRKPQQDRSRASFDRVLDATIDLIKELGYDKVTLTDVSRRARTSIGSIYCRVKSKEDLMLAVQTRVFEGMTEDTNVVLDPAKWEHLDLHRMVRFLIRETAELLRRHAPVLRAFTVSQPYDRVVTTAGREWHLYLGKTFEKILTQRIEEISHPNPQYAISFCFDVTYAALTKYLGIGIIPDYVALDNWAQLTDELGNIFSNYLLGEQLQDDVFRPKSESSSKRHSSNGRR
jgi:AcrR family transcriptional regulator